MKESKQDEEFKAQYFNQKSFKGFANRSYNSQIMLYRSMPERLKETLFGGDEYELPEEIETRSHYGHTLVMRQGKHELIDEDGHTWICDHLEGVNDCLHA